MINAVTVGATSTEVLSADPVQRRKRVVFTNNSNEDIYISDDSVAQSTYGLPLKAQGGVMVDEPDTTGFIYQGQWNAICASGGKVLSVLVIYERQ